MDGDISFKQEVSWLVVVEMTVGVMGTFCNLMVVTTVRDQDSLQQSTANLLLANICFSNLLVSFLVKPISAIYVSYALSTGKGLAFKQYHSILCGLSLRRVARGSCVLQSVHSDLPNNLAGLPTLPVGSLLELPQPALQFHLLLSHPQSPAGRGSRAWLPY